MFKAAKGGYRARLAIELADEDRADIESWLGGQFDPAVVEVMTGRRLLVVLCDLAGRDPEQLRRRVERLGALSRRPLVLRPGPELQARPSRSRPRLFFLPFDGYGPLLAGTAELDEFDGADLGAAASAGKVARLFMPVGVTRIVAAPGAGEAGGGWPVPRRWPQPVPVALRRRMNAVRLAVYPSQTTSESRELTPLAQVELPIAAAVR